MAADERGAVDPASLMAMIDARLQELSGPPDDEARAAAGSPEAADVAPTTPPDLAVGVARPPFPALGAADEGDGPPGAPGSEPPTVRRVAIGRVGLPDGALSAAMAPAPAIGPSRLDDRSHAEGAEPAQPTGRSRDEVGPDAADGAASGDASSPTGAVATARIARPAWSLAAVEAVALDGPGSGDEVASDGGVTSRPDARAIRGGGPDPGGEGPAEGLSAPPPPPSARGVGATLRANAATALIALGVLLILLAVVRAA